MVIRPDQYPLFLLLLLSTACSLRPAVYHDQKGIDNAATNLTPSCIQLLVHTEKLVSVQGIRDVQDVGIKAYPFFRVNRFLASFKNHLDTEDKRNQWLTLLRELDQQGRAAEIGNLLIVDDSVWPPGVRTRDQWLESLAACGEQTIQTVRENPDRMRDLVTRTRVPDSYSEIQRFLGLYPLVKRLVTAGVSRLHAETLENFRLSSVNGANKPNILYRPPEDEIPPDPESIALILARSRNNPLAIPLLEKGPELDRLFRYYAPVWRIEQESSADRMGALFWQSGQAAVDTDRPLTYAWLSQSRFEDRIVPQLNYILWFPSRPATGPMDILSGRLDGITWRVTLDLDGQVLMYDAIHNCGCYHMFFPGTGVQERKIPEREDEEAILVPARMSDNDPGRIIITLEARTHFIIGLDKSESLATGTLYAFTQYDDLRSLPLPGTGHRSVFSPQGIIPGTGRKEKWLLWPMGVSDPGAMKQWGHHAIAFVGRRHFDDPFLLERYFSRK